MIVEIRSTRCVILDGTLSWKGKRSLFAAGESFAVNDMQYEILAVNKSDFQENVFNATLRELK